MIDQRASVSIIKVYLRFDSGIRHPLMVHYGYSHLAGKSIEVFNAPDYVQAKSCVNPRINLNLPIHRLNLTQINASFAVQKYNLGMSLPVLRDESSNSRCFDERSFILIL